MLKDGIILKGNKDGLSVVIDMNKFENFDDMMEDFVQRLTLGKKFYRNATIKIITQLKEFNEKQIIVLKDVLFDEFMIKDCILRK